ncbi:283_t:CDS:2 [Diversispora eburnea]|uniref:283_t:CDS:1 n=1 Tax=Diversispora eburnea TaxID=1213867 RepID=A0A9N8VN34_9GLOM|nr:283_t:CDS:2 [Diversispora eburnea]
MNSTLTFFSSPAASEEEIMSNIKIQCIAIIGKMNNPLYIKNFTDTHPDLKYHYIAHTSIDVIEERILDAVIKNTDMKNIFRKIHTAYINQVCNPFYNLDGKKSIVSKKFIAAIDSIGKSNKINV